MSSPTAPMVVGFNPALTQRFKDYFAGSGCESEVEQFAAFTRARSFPNVLNVHYNNGNIRYFNIGESLWERVKAVFQTSVTESQSEFPSDLNEVFAHMKARMMVSKQLILRADSRISSIVASAASTTPGCIECFQVKSNKEDLDLFAVDIRIPQSG